MKMKVKDLRDLRSRIYSSAVVRELDEVVPVSSGEVGELRVAEKLLGLGFDVEVMPSCNKIVDLVVKNRRTGRTSTIQVKSKSNADKFWIMPRKKENADWIVAVNFSKSPECPEYYIIPGERINSMLRPDNTERGRAGKNPESLMYDTVQPFREKWELENDDA